MKLVTPAIILLALAGVLVSALALREHYTTETSPCSINDQWDCGAVNKSPYAVFRGVPVAIIGILGYAALAALAGRARLLTALAALAALAFALRLTWIEWKVLEMWCVYCVASQGIILVISALAVTDALFGRRRRA